MSVAWKIALTIVLGIAMLILNVWLYEHRLDPPETDWKATLYEMHRYDATGRRLLPLILLVDVLFIVTFVWMMFEFRRLGEVGGLQVRKGIRDWASHGVNGVVSTAPPIL